jgi:hypothetical protein
METVFSLIASLLKTHRRADPSLDFVERPGDRSRSTIRNDRPGHAFR